MESGQVAAEVCGSFGNQDLVFESYPNREIAIEGLQVSRALPIREKRMVGPWCFLDRFGPHHFSADKPMDVAPHPHTGLQTVTWLLEGEILHDDSLGSQMVGRPGGVNVMTAGRGIAHAEQTPSRNSGLLNGVQLWVALPDTHRNRDPDFAAVERVPVIEKPQGIVQIFAGNSNGTQSPAPHFSDLVGMDINVFPGPPLEIGLEPGFEHAVLLLSGDVSLEHQILREKTMYYLGKGRHSLSLSSTKGCRLLLIGGPPFGETILMWWNFVARTPEEISQARTDWEEHRRFGDVSNYRGQRLAAPELHRVSRPNPVS